jgi:leader peptidase (prepilin peptidase)/N-methyltransferase
MEWWQYMPVVMWCFWVFVLGLMVGSFLNVLIARLPYEKSIVWPSSRCFACYRRIRLLDNLPIIGYLRLRGRCRHCGCAFSSRYLWVEVGTGVAFLALFVAEVYANWHGIPANKVNAFGGDMVIPPLRFWAMFAYHAFFVSCLIAAAVIDAEHRLIPSLIPYAGVVVGVVGGALMPWPWPNPPQAGTLAVPNLPPDAPWSLPEFWGLVPAGVQPWPFWGPTFSFAPPGSWQLGLLTSLTGALVGSLVMRAIKWLFETGFGREALGMGDADLMMMAGAFLGWQIAALSVFAGAVVAIALKILSLLLFPREEAPPADAAQPATLVPPDANPRELPFGPGLAIGVVVTWFAWPWLSPRLQYPFFDHVAMGLSVGIMCVGLLAAGLLLRRPEEAPAETEAKV